MTHKLPSTKQNRRLRVRGKLKAALDLMTWGDAEGVPHEWDEAARRAKYGVSSMRSSLEKAHVRQYMSAQRTYLRAAIAAKNPRRLATIADGPNAAAAVRAVQVLEGLDAGDHGRSPGTLTLPGLTIQIIQAPPVLPAHQGVTIDVDPMPMRQKVARDDEP